MTKLNVVDFGEYKELKAIRQSETKYEAYLQSLQHSQLELEVNHLLQDRETKTQDLLSRGQLILKEIATRAHSSVRKKIEHLKKEF